MIDRINALKSEYNKKLGKKEQIENDIKLMEDNLDSMTKLHDNLHAVNVLLTQTSNKAREIAKVKLEKIVTNALKFIYEDDIEFIIELDTQRGIPSCEFYVKTFTRGEMTVQRPQDACGGGFVDIISAALRFAYFKALKSPALANVMIFDEPGKQIDEYANVKFPQFVKDLGDTFKTQTIMVTHNTNNVINVSDKVFMVDAEDGVSKVII